MPGDPAAHLCSCNTGLSNTSYSRLLQYTSTTSSSLFVLGHFLQLVQILVSFNELQPSLLEKEPKWAVSVGLFGVHPNLNGFV